MLNNVHKDQRQGIITPYKDQHIPKTTRKLHIIPHQWEVNYL
jgi:hypothetical protein